MISIAIPYHGDRFKWTMKTIRNCHNLPNVIEIVVTVDPSDTSSVNLERECKMYRKVNIIKNEKRLFVFRNKIRAVARCSGDWVALIDSDNIINAAYLGAFMNQAKKEHGIIYHPAMAHPRIDFYEYVGRNITLNYAADQIGNQTFNMLLNNMNYVFHRETWLEALVEARKSDFEPITADSAYINYHCLKNGMVIKVVSGMEYIHTLHGNNVSRDMQSTYKLYSNEGWQVYEKIMDAIRNTARLKPVGRFVNDIQWTGFGGSARKKPAEAGCISQSLVD